MTALVTTSGVVAERYVMDVWGLIRTVIDNTGTPTDAAWSLVGNPWTFTGRQFEFEERTGLYHCRARAYGDALGQFLQRDPIGVWGDAGNDGGARGYVGHRPANRRDPLGLYDPYGPGDPFGGHVPLPPRPSAPTGRIDHFIKGNFPTCAECDADALADAAEGVYSALSKATVKAGYQGCIEVSKIVNAELHAEFPGATVQHGFNEGWITTRYWENSCSKCIRWYFVYSWHPRTFGRHQAIAVHSVCDPYKPKLVLDPWWYRPLPDGWTTYEHWTYGASHGPVERE